MDDFLVMQFKGVDNTVTVHRAAFTECWAPLGWTEVKKADPEPAVVDALTAANPVAGV